MTTMTILDGTTVEASGTHGPMRFEESYFMLTNGWVKDKIILADGSKLFSVTADTRRQKYGYYALQDKETNELHCISCYPYNGYRNTFDAQVKSYFDTSDMKSYTSMNWVAHEIDFIKMSLQTRYRKNLSHYNLVVMEWSEDYKAQLPIYSMRHHKIGEESYHLKYIGPSPVSRTQLENLVKIHVLTEDIQGVGHKTEANRKVEAIEVKVI